MSDRPTVLTTQRYQLGEGARWVEDRLVFVDILSGRLLEVGGDAPGDARQVTRLDVPLGAAAPVAGAAGKWIVAAGTGIGLLHGDGTLEWLDRPEDSNPAPARMNDGVCDPAGRFWAGSMAYDATPGAGSLYRADPDGTVRRLLDGITVPNGPAFDPDGDTLYYADSPTGVVYRCAIDPATSGTAERCTGTPLTAADGRWSPCPRRGRPACAWADPPAAGSSSPPPGTAWTQRRRPPARCSQWTSPQPRHRPQRTGPPPPRPPLPGQGRRDQAVPSDLGARRRQLPDLLRGRRSRLSACRRRHPREGG